MGSANIAQNTLYLTVASVGQKILAFVYFMFIARVMKVEGTGAYFLAISLTTIFSIVADFGMQPVIIREIAKGREVDRLIRTVLGIKIPLMILAFFTVIIASHLLGYDPLVQKLVSLAAVVMVLDSVSLTFYGILRGQQLLKYESLGIFLGQALILLVGGSVLLMSPSLPMLIVALIAGSSFNALFSLFIVVRRFGTKALIPTWDNAFVQRVLKIALPFALAGAFVKVYSYIDTVLLSQFLGAGAVGIYAIAYKLTYAFQFLPMAFIAALYPGISSLLVNDRDRVVKVFEDAMWYMMLLATPIVLGIWSIADQLIPAFVGSEFMESILPLQILIFVLFFIFLDFPIGALLNAADRQVTKTIIMGATMVVNVVLNLILIPQYGVVGATISALGGFLVLFVAGLYFVPQIISWKPVRLIRRLYPILISGIIMATVSVFLKEYLHFVLVIALASVVYFALLFGLKALSWKQVKQGMCLIKF
ncbi:MAG: flippase [Candidatus Uhrbacteria bacterium]